MTAAQEGFNEPGGSGGEGARRRRMRLAAGIILAVAAAAGAYRWLARQSDPEIIRISGNIEITDAEVSFRIAGRVAERLVSEGEPIQQGQPVARLERQELDQSVALSEAAAAAAAVALAELEAGSRAEEIAQAEAAARQAQARLDELTAGSRPAEIETAGAALGYGDLSFTRRHPTAASV